MTAAPEGRGIGPATKKPAEALAAQPTGTAEVVPESVAAAPAASVRTPGAAPTQVPEVRALQAQPEAGDQAVSWPGARQQPMSPKTSVPGLERLSAYPWGTLTLVLTGLLVLLLGATLWLRVARARWP